MGKILILPFYKKNNINFNLSQEIFGFRLSLFYISTQKQIEWRHGKKLSLYSLQAV
jgi:hypothetical protein